MRAVVSDPRHRPGIAVITVEEGLDVSALTASDIEQIAEIASRFRDAASVRSALVAGADSPTRYGLSRMFEGYAEIRELGEVNVFETIDQAVSWVAASPEAQT